jgi:hypothetical protein
MQSLTTSILAAKCTVPVRLTKRTHATRASIETSRVPLRGALLSGAVTGRSASSRTDLFAPLLLKLPKKPQPSKRCSQSPET